MDSGKGFDGTFFYSFRIEILPLLEKKIATSKSSPYNLPLSGLGVWLRNY